MKSLIVENISFYRQYIGYQFKKALFYRTFREL